MAAIPLTGASLMQREDDTSLSAADAFIVSTPAPSVQPPRRGRPPVAEPKPKVTIRLPVKTLEALRQSGRGWQTRLARLASEMVAAEAARGPAEACAGAVSQDRKREA